jgi:endonuclease-3
MSIDEVTRLLAQEYGSRQWHCHYDPISELILTVLSQNTSDVNARRAFFSLSATFGSWEAVVEGDAEKIAQAIKCGGLSRVKAVRIKQMLQSILKQRGSFDLAFLSELPVSQAEAWLEQLPGVGPKTASCVLLFSLNMPALPVDTHLYRVARRLGLINSKVSVEKAHQILEDMVPAEDIYSFHLNMIEHGRRICHAQRPRCSECVFQQSCPSNEGGNGGEGKIPGVGGRSN